MSTWIFIRHGQSIANVQGWFSGQRDVELTMRGEEEARRLKVDLKDIRVNRVFSSDLIRARRTAEIALADTSHDIILEPRLRERSCGDYEGMSSVELKDNGTHAVLMAFDGRPPGGESLKDVALRAMGFLASVSEVAGPTLVFCHGALIRSVIGVLDGRPRAQISQWKPTNCEMVKRDVMPDTWSRLHAQLLEE